MSGSLQCRRVYDAVDPNDGQRVLVDRLWPRGVRKDDPRVGLWLPDAAPSGELRTWYGHREERYQEFADRYRAELDGSNASEALDRLRQLIEAGPVTLVTASREVANGHLPVLSDYLTD
jgi:uncharacterized protein YeaO (DUF488 family)